MDCRDRPRGFAAPFAASSRIRGERGRTRERARVGQFSESKGREGAGAINDAMLKWEKVSHKGSASLAWGRARTLSHQFKILAISQQNIVSSSSFKSAACPCVVSRDWLAI